MFAFGMTILSYDVAISPSGQATYTPQEEHRMSEQRARWEQRDPSQSPPTTKQRALLDKLLLCREFSAEEVTTTKRWVDTDATEESMSRLISRAQRRVNMYRQREKDAAKRKKAYHANKEGKKKGVQDERAEEAR